MKKQGEEANFAQSRCNVSPFRMNTCKSVSKQRTLTPFRMNTYEKQGGGGAPLGGTSPRSCARTSLLRCPNSRRPEHEDRPLPTAEHREKVQHLFPREILLVEQLHPPGSLFARDDLGTRFQPLPKDFAARIARSDSHAWVVANAFHFSRDANRVHV